MKFVNCTNRDIVIVDGNGNEKLVIKPSGIVVGHGMRAETVETYLSPDNAIQCIRYEYDSVHGLPKPEAGTRFIVSYAALQALKGSRADVISPDTSPGSIVREERSQHVLGVRQFRIL